MKTLTEFFNFLSNSLLFGVLLGVMVLAGISVYSLSPRSYESTLKEPQVLGIHDSPLSQVRNSKYEAIFEGNEYLPMRTYESDESYLMRINFDPSIVEGEFNQPIIRITNQGESYENYLVRFKSDSNNLNFEGISLQINQIDTVTSTHPSGIRYADIKIAPGGDAEVGIQMDLTNGQDTPFEFELEIIEVEDILVDF